MERANFSKEARLQFIKLVASLIVFVFALHVLCSHDNQIALARARAAGSHAGSAAIPLERQAAAAETMRLQSSNPHIIDASIIR